MAINARWLAGMVESRQALPFKFAGQVFINDGRNAVYWPGQDVLIVSDMHLEKGSFLGKFANPIPHYDSRKTLELLSALIADYLPATIVCLGDTFHDNAAFSRMQRAELNQLFLLIEKVPNWIWILGNHDPKLPQELGGIQTLKWCREGILFLHEPDETIEPQMIGHFHPKAQVKEKRMTLRGRCLVHSQQLLIMPALGQYTGGLTVEDEAIATLLDKTASGYINYEGRVFPFNLSNV
ncbi:ligase-associated DNA damage response endonuclease PdeM [Alteromonas sediminis]|uniref:Ligase-associated DNA damage response endonuclease PdeM n=1 Tax=Alteromonas sediminis TaxID=2259342 RepID=A0A3N5Z8C6_9ALTE|nr:ligase-associated DNA damage response endonuclease PdeM [Alteromonas sediminis]RPJ65238.1 ligase-associated DNA damage response endonuclease PdeM [Alteromonas sediminis]